MPKNHPPVCYQCQESNLKLTKEWNNKYYCSACLKWIQEAEKSGISTCYRYTSTSCGLTCRNYGYCLECQAKQGLTNYSTPTLMEEVLYRKDFIAVTTWEDDSFLHRFQEIIWELKESKEMTAEQIQTQVNKDILRKVSRRRKYSKGV
jgi:hypothetical protein